MGKRVAEAGGGLAAAAKAVGLMNHAQLLRDYNQRVRESYNDQREALGLEVDDTPEGDPVGNIYVTGDIKVEDPKAIAAAVPWSTQPPAGVTVPETAPVVTDPKPSTEPVAKPSTWRDKILPVVLAGTLGAGAATAATYLFVKGTGPSNPTTTTGSSPDSDTTVFLEGR